MNSFAVKMIGWGAAALAGGVALLMLIDEYPAAAWQGPLVLLLGCVLIFIGRRNLYDRNPSAGPAASVGSFGQADEPGRSKLERVFESAASPIEKHLPGRASSNAIKPALVTMALVLGFLVVLVVKVGRKTEAERQKREPAVPQRQTLGTLSDRAFVAEDFLMASAEVPEAEQELIHKAREFVRDENYQAAIDCLLAPEQKDWFAARLYYLGCALQHLNRNQEAVDVLSKFIEAQGEANAYSIYRRDTRYYRAKALVALGRFPEAVSDLTAAIEIAPAAELHELRAAAYEKLGNGDSAAQDRRRSVELDPPLVSPR